MKPNNGVFWAFVTVIVAVFLLSALGFILIRSDKAIEGLYRIVEVLAAGALGFFAREAVTPNPTPPVEPATKEQS